MTWQLSELKTDAPISLLFHTGELNIVNNRSDVVSIDPFDTIHRARQISDDEWGSIKQSPFFMRLFRLVFPNIDLPEHGLQLHGSGVQHVVGLLVLTFEAVNAGKTPFWRTPEAHLHPRGQLGLGDLAIYLATHERNRP